LKTLGDGKTSDVCLAKHVIDGTLVALKVFKNNDIQLATIEYNLMEKLAHPQILGVIGRFLDKPALHENG